MGTLSQDGQDRFVLDFFVTGFQGFYVDIGAYDGIEFSNTYVLEKNYGWSGLAVECDPAIVGLLAKNRNCDIDTRAVWREDNNEVIFKTVEGGKLSGIVDTLTHKKALEREGYVSSIRTVSLKTLLDEHKCPKHINYMSLDVEGAELDVLESFDFSYTFDVVSIEHLRDKDKIIEIMLKHGYRIEKTILEGNETIFVKDFTAC